MGAKAAIHLGTRKGFSSQLGNENERRAWDEDMYKYKNQDPKNRYDWTRRHLNFEITKGAIADHGMIIPLGSQKVSLYNRYLNVLSGLGFKEYKEGATNKQNTCIDFIITGDHDRLCEIAYGNSKIAFDLTKDNSGTKLVISPGEDIEDIKRWALDNYKYIAKKYGEDNIVGFEVHLDETTPHIHVLVVPTAIKNQRGNVGGYVKITDKGEPATYQKGKHVGEEIRISQKKYDALSEEKKREYRPVVRKQIKTISMAEYLGKNRHERAEKLSAIHDEYHEAVGKKWGLERGVIIKDLPIEEQPKHRHKGKGLWWDEQKSKERKEENERKAAEAESRAKDAGRYEIIANNNAVMANARARQAKEEEEKARLAAKAEQEKAEKAKAAADAAEKRAEDARNREMTSEYFAEEADKKAEEANNRAIEAEKREAAANEKASEAEGREQAAVNNAYYADQDAESVRESTKKAVEKYNKLVSDTNEESQKLAGVKAEVSRWAATVIDEKALEFPGLDQLTFTYTEKNGVKVNQTFRDLLTKAMNDIIAEISKEKPFMVSGSDWRKQQRENVRAIITNMETKMFGEKGMEKAYKDAVREFGKSLYKDTRKKISELTKENESLKKQVDTLSSENSNLKKQFKETSDALENSQKETKDYKERAENAESNLKDFKLDLTFMNMFTSIPKIADEFNKWLENTCRYVLKVVIDGVKQDSCFVVPKGVDETIRDVLKGIENAAEDIAGGFEDVFTTSILLYVGNVGAATATCSSCGGGGGGPTEGWGKKKDDDDEEWARRCALMARGMHRRTPRQVSSGWKSRR